jgi:putative membrane protein
MNWVIRFLINAIAIFLIAKFVPGFDHATLGPVGALIAALIFGIVNAILGPILRLITLPINWITHGLFSLVINYLLFWLTVYIAPGFKNDPSGGIAPWLANLIGAAIMMLISTGVVYMSRTEAERAAQGS